MSRETEGFLGRWSARKQAARDETLADLEADADSVETAQPDPEKTDAEILEELGLKDPDELQAGDDFSGFMSGAIPERLRNRALRKLWLTNPVLANLDELVDYGEDFTDAATVVEDLQTAYRVGKGFLRQEEIDAAEAAAEDDESELVVEAEEPLQGDEPEESAVAFSPDGSSEATSETDESRTGDAMDVAVENAETEPTPQDAGIPRPRRMVFRTGVS